jgi:hypothetical protein
MNWKVSTTVFVLLGCVVVAASFGLRHSFITADVSAIANDLGQAQVTISKLEEELRRTRAALNEAQLVAESENAKAIAASSDASEVAKMASALEKESQAAEDLRQKLELISKQRDALLVRLGNLEAEKEPKVNVSKPSGEAMYEMMADLWRDGHVEARTVKQFEAKLGSSTVLVWRLSPELGYTRITQGGSSGAYDWSGTWDEQSWADEIYPRFKQTSRKWWPEALRVMRDSIVREQIWDMWGIYRAKPQISGIVNSCEPVALEFYVWPIGETRRVVAAVPVLALTIVGGPTERGANRIVSLKTIDLDDWPDPR